MFSRFVGQSPEMVKVKMFDHVYLTKGKSNELTKQGIPYAEEWFMATKATENGLVLNGSCGGQTVIGWDEAVITRVDAQNIGDLLVRPRFSVITMDEDLSISKSVLAQEGLDSLDPKIYNAILTIVDGNPGAARAASHLLKEEGIKNILSSADVERVLGIKLDTPPSQLADLRAKLWIRFKS